jgi:hypothetical protein
VRRYLLSGYPAAAIAQSGAAELLIAGLAAVGAASVFALVLRHLRHSYPWVATLAASAALVFGVLMFPFAAPIRQGCIVRPGIPWPLALMLAAASYLPAAEASRRRAAATLVPLLAGRLVLLTYEEVSYWGGFGHVGSADFLFAGAVVAPVSLAFAKRS